MNDPEGVALLQWAAPRLGLRWRGFKNVRRQVVRRISARMKELGIASGADYRALLERDANEVDVLRRLCFVTISRFYRDHRVYDALRDRLLPELASRVSPTSPEHRGVIRAWSAGCASGEEPYGVMLVWRLCVAPQYPSVELEIVATDFDETVLERAGTGIYEEGSLRELPLELRSRAFERRVGPDSSVLYRVRDEIRRGIDFVRADVRVFLPEPPVDLVLCRNLVFTYFDEPAQRTFLERALSVMSPHALLIIGSHENLPAQGDVRAGTSMVAPDADVPLVFRRGRAPNVTDR